MYKFISINYKGFRKLKEKKSERLYTVLACSISTFVVLAFMLVFMYIHKIAPFGTYSFAKGDCFVYTRPLLVMLHDKLNHGNGFMYQWSGGLGSDFLVNYFYALSSPFNFLVYFFDYSKIDSFISLTVAFKISISASTMCFYLCNRNKMMNGSYFLVGALSCCYALCNYMCAYFTQPMWLDSLAVFPIVMLGYDRLKNNNKFVLYTLSLAYCIYCNYYLSYIISIFILLYYLVDEHESLKDFIFKGLRFAIYSILSFLISGVSLYVSYKGIMKTVSMDESKITHSWYGNFAYILRQFYILSKPIISSSNDNDTNIYCGLICLFLFFVYLFSTLIPKKKKISQIILVIFLLISMNENLINCIWHGFHQQHNVPNRFSFLLVFIMITISSDVLENIKELTSKTIIAAWVISLVLPIVIYCINDFNGIIPSKFIIEISLFVMMIYGVFFTVLSFRKDNTNVFLSALIGVIIFCELVFNALFTLKEGIYYVGYKQTHESNVYNLMNNVESKTDDMFYRSETIEFTAPNSNSIYGMKGWAAYNSTMPKYISNFLNNMGYHYSANCLLNTDDVSIVNSLLGVRYIYDSLPVSFYDNMIGYERVAEFEDVKVYQNNYQLPLGYGICKENLNSFKFSPGYSFENINNLVYSLSGEGDIISVVQPDLQVDFDGCNCEIADSNNGRLNLLFQRTESEFDVVFEFNVQEAGDYYFELFEDPFLVVSVYSNDTFIKESDYLSNGIINLGFVSPEDKIKIVLSNKKDDLDVDSNVTNMFVRIGLVNPNVYNEMVSILSKNPMNLESFHDTYIKANVNLADNQILFTTIPYDEGWHVYEDGKEIQKQRVAGAFIGLDLGKGKHNLEFKYTTEGFYVGLLISIVGWIIFGVLFIYSKIKSKNERNIKNENQLT